MKIRRSVLWFVVACAILIVLVVWLGKKPSATLSPGVADTNVVPQSSAERSVSGTSSRKPETPAHTNAPVARVAPGASTPPPPLKTRSEQIREGLAEMNDVPIVFYGKLEDQLGNPVVGAQVAGNVIIYNGMRAGAEHVSVTSDANGFFQINAGKGESLGIMPHKDGYALATTRTEFKYSYMYNEHFTPDPSNPVVFKMWKLQGAEPLVNIDKTYRPQYSDAPMNFDLVSGEMVPAGGDVKIKVNRPSGEVSERNPQKWSIDLEVVGGGFIETSGKESAITFAAPEDGYQSSGAFRNNNGPDLVDKTLFIQSRKGQVFSKIHLLFGINNTPNGVMDVSFTGVANTNGSRNWEATAPR